MLLDRDTFRESVFTRDHHQCVMCGAPAVDAHHLLERRLFSDSGYYLNNGVSLCNLHHLDAERTIISCEDLRKAAGIQEVILPLHLYADQEYDKWGNPILPNGSRLRGELFEDASVQKILADGGVLHLFTNRIKYPRSYHLPWSHGMTKDDRRMEDLARLQVSEVVVTEKLDGENTTLYSDYVHARSLDYNPHPSRNWLKGLHSRIGYNIPEGWRVCGENLFAKHSILYQDLPDYFLVFSIWNDKNWCLSWDETVEWAQLLGLQTVPVIYRGSFDEETIRKLYPEPRCEDREGYVVRITEGFAYRDFRFCLGKYVRQGHVAPETHHWRAQAVIPNQVRKDTSNG